MPTPHPRRRRLQLPAPHAVAEDFIVPSLGRHPGAAKINRIVKERFFTDDNVTLLAENHTA
jgi:hypothetical protein